jgi:outer membrane protein
MKRLAMLSLLVLPLGVTLSAPLGVGSAWAQSAPTAAPQPPAPPAIPSAPTSAPPAPRALTLPAAVELALGQQPDLEIARQAVSGSDAHAAAIKARRYAGLRLDASANAYTEAYELPFGAQTLTLHEQVTSATAITLSQPLTGLIYLSALVGAAEHEVAASRSEYDRARLDAAFRTADAYVRALSAQSRAEIARRSVVDLQSGLDRALQFRQAESYTDIDVLRFRSAKAGADQVAVRAAAAVDSALATLVQQLGLPDGTAIELRDDLAEKPLALLHSLEDAQRAALSHRPELTVARAKVAAAGDARRAARAAYLPDIRAVAVWEHVTGVQPFQPKNSEFVGVRLSWNAWDWGATHQAVVEAEHTKARAELAAGVAAEQVRVEVRKRWLEAKSLFESLDAAAQQQQTADEAYRLQKVRFDNAASTATEVLDAETEAARARAGYASARYDYYLAVFALSRAVGNLPAP